MGVAATLPELGEWNLVILKISPNKVHCSIV